MQSQIYSIMRLPIERTANTTKGPCPLTYITSHTYSKKKINALFHLKSRSCRNGITFVWNIGMFLQDKASPNPEEYHVNYHCHKAWRHELFSYSTWQLATQLPFMSWDAKQNPAVVTPLVSVSGRKPQPDFLIFRTCLKYCSVMTNVRNDQSVGLCAEFHGYIRIQNLLQREMWTCRRDIPWNSASPIHWPQDSLWFSEERGFVENPQEFRITMKLLALRSIRQTMHV